MTADRVPPPRPPLEAAALNGHIVRPDGLWREVSVVERTGSTNADLIARARDGAPEGLVLAAEEQTSGRGRMGRAWLSPPRAALTFSVLLRPAAVPPARRGWLPLLAGVATAAAVRQVSGLEAQLKWPNDVLIGGRKLAGILAEQAGDAVVVGIGVNVSTGAGELPATGPSSLAATSLLLAGSASLDRELLLRQVLAELERWYLAWRSGAGGDPQATGLRSAYLEICSTLGRDVRAELPGGQVIYGSVADIDADGRLVVAGPAGVVAVGAGDVLHVR
ncbi:MAG TPA: biotin--[acetyl-CoA-carboxylase] ligase [Streptosporangiaceae bacterium]|jgi:BirA family biotin operon repressor/biotin-[acetyl-CoA-carboxylase] ligase|nr:biotin--[acetyl-CoA-carboxylase] ligase [Streptosporangiaceae bacterium]